MNNWKQDREALRQLAKDPAITADGKRFIYTLISHMRGKIHMRFMKKWSGGWVWARGEHHEMSPREQETFRKAYGDRAQFFYNKAVIANLADQATFIKQEGSFYLFPKLENISERILAGYDEEGKCNLVEE